MRLVVPSLVSTSLNGFGYSWKSGYQKNVFSTLPPVAVD